MQVLRELERKEDEITEWAKKHKELFFRDLNEEEQETLIYIQNNYEGLIDPNKEIADADPSL